jgi:CRP-like cAMP-binding protein
MRSDPYARLRQLPLFSECSDRELAEIDSLCDQVKVPAGRQLIGQGEIGREFVIIVEGEATVSRDGVEVATLGAGAHFGELALLATIERNATVVAKTDVVAQVIDRRGFQTALEDSPSLCLALLRSTAQRLAALDASQ